MTRMWIVVGDATTSGGRVISGSPFTDIDGRPVSRVTDRATCPTHKGAFPIVDGDATTIIDGQPVALHGSSLACGCKVLAGRQARVFVDAAGGGTGSTAAPAAVPNPRDPVATTPAAGDTRSGYDEQIQFRGPTGALLANAGYVLHLDDGTTVEGVSDEHGRTQRVNTPAPAAIIKAELTPPAHADVCCATAGLPSQTVVMATQGAATHAAAVGMSVHRVTAEPAEDRGLTVGEIAMLRQVFGDAVDCTSVKIHNHGYWMLFGFQPDDTATAPDGKIYLPADLFSVDFSMQRTRRQRLLVHEITHVWQYQLGYPIKRVRGPRPNMSYGYTLDGVKRFCDYNMEAQGNIIADYFLLAIRSDPDALYERKYRSTPNALSLYERTLRNFLSNPSDRGNLPKVMT